ncbi:MAG: hypothetical protein ACKVN9_06170 [Methylophilaceae bacterium]
MNPNTLLELLELLAEVESEDPIDFSGLPFEAKDLRHLACLNVSELLEQMPHNPIEEREIVMATAMVRLVLENMVLNARLAILNQEDSL